MRSRRARLSWLASVPIAAAIALHVTDAGAHEPDAYNLGSRASAMAGAVGADAADFAAGYYNPAGLAEVPGVEVALGYLYAWNTLRVNGRDTAVADVHGLVAGLVAPGEVFGVPFAFGLATHVPDDGLSRIRALKQETPRWELYADRNAILFLATNLAIRPVRWLEVGGGLAFLAATRGRFGISGRADVLAPYASQLRHEVDADLTSIRYPHAGLRVLWDGLGAVGLTYRGQSKLRLELDAHLEGDVVFAGAEVPLLYELEARTVAAFLPQQVVLSLSFQRIENLHLNLDLAWVDWSAYESPTARTKAHLEADLPAGANIDLPQDPKPTKIEPLRFEDRIVPRVGVEYVVPALGAARRVHGRDRRLLEIPIRAGYAFEASPVPPQTGITNFVDADRHTIALGTGVVVNAPFAELPGTLRLDVHGQLSVLPERRMEKANAADFVGDYAADGTQVVLGTTLSASF